MAEPEQPLLQNAPKRRSWSTEYATVRYFRTLRVGECISCRQMCCCFFVSFVLLSLVVCILSIIIHQENVQVTIAGTSLTEFDLNPNSTLHYNLSFNVSIRNPNKKIEFFYDRIEANVYYKGQHFGAKMLAPFHQEHNNTSMLCPVFTGQSLLVLKGSGIGDYNKDRKNGVFKINTKILLLIRNKIIGIESEQLKTEIKCDMAIPLTSANGASNSKFKYKCEHGSFR